MLAEFFVACFIEKRVGNPREQICGLLLEGFNHALFQVHLVEASFLGIRHTRFRSLKEREVLNRDGLPTVLQLIKLLREIRRSLIVLVGGDWPFLQKLVPSALRLRFAGDCCYWRCFTLWLANQLG